MALVLASPALTACSPNVLAHPGRLFGGGAKAPKASPNAIVEAREQSAVAPQEPYWPARLGQLYLASDSLPQAEAALESALARDRFYAPALSYLSKLYYQDGRHAQAVQRLEAVRTAKAAYGEELPAALLAGLALHYDAIDRPDLASAAMAALPRPDRGRASSAQVYVLLRGPAPDSAAALAKADLHDHPRSAASRNNYGITRLRAGDPEEARRAFKDAIEIDPTLAGPYYNLAILEKYYLLDDAAAATWLARYWERATDDPDGLAAAIGGREPVAGTRNDP